MEIKNGYNGKKVEIKIIPVCINRTTEMWIKFEHKPTKNETLSFLTLDELLNLKEEVQNAIMEIARFVK